jgi:lipid-binding SYLF domain-containing protein
LGEYIHIPSEKIMRIKLLATSVLIGAGIALAGCTTTTMNSSSASPSDKQGEIRSSVHASMDRLYSTVRGSRDLVAHSRAVLVFPDVLAAGLGIGGEYGEGELLINGAGAGFYRTVSASFGFQAGAQSKAIYFIFENQEALDKFRAAKGWAAGVDASVAFLKVGANGDIDSNSVRAPISVIVLTNAGLMYNVTIEGTKVTKI